MEKPLIIIYMQFTKTFYSIKRDKPIEIQMENKINPQIITVIAAMYEGGKTKVEVSNAYHITLRSDK